MCVVEQRRTVDTVDRMMIVDRPREG
jgi:hypothetical protein